METQPKSTERQLALSSMGLALFWVIFLWGFWEKGPQALGFNTTVFLLLALTALAAIFPKHQPLQSRRNLVWLVPCVLIALSYSVYDNPFIKMVSIPIWPLALLSFTTDAMFIARPLKWGGAILTLFIARAFAILSSLFAAGQTYLALLLPASSNRKQTERRVALGLALLFVLAFTIIIPLLSAADPAFAAALKPIYEQVLKIISASAAARIIVFILLALFFLAVLLAWRKTPAAPEAETKIDVDNIVAGITIGGVLALYLVFLWLQLNRLWVNELPIDFKTAESLVKSGFWQLFALSIINGVIFLAIFGKTNQTVRRILLAFTTASLLLVVSAAWRVGLYDVYYGLSYEKFFASYTVLYSLILFGYLLTKFFTARPANITKTLSLLFLWMFALAAIMPVEQFIMRANLALAERPDSRLKLYEMTMLSSDVLGLVEDKKNDPRFADWDDWIEKRKKELNAKAWHELNAMDIMYKFK